MAACWELHAAMDRAVLDAYGWTDLTGDPELFAAARRRKKPWSYRSPDDFRDEVLARLLELNKKRAEEEKLSGAAAEAKEKKKAKRAKRSKASEQRLF